MDISIKRVMCYFALLMMAGNCVTYPHGLNRTQMNDDFTTKWTNSDDVHVAFKDQKGFVAGIVTVFLLLAFGILVFVVNKYWSCSCAKMQRKWEAVKKELSLKILHRADADPGEGVPMRSYTTDNTAGSDAESDDGDAPHVINGEIKADGPDGFQTMV